MMEGVYAEDEVKGSLGKGQVASFPTQQATSEPLMHLGQHSGREIQPVDMRRDRPQFRQPMARAAAYLKSPLCGTGLSQREEG
jgi:hypothetical protein